MKFNLKTALFFLLLSTKIIAQQTHNFTISDCSNYAYKNAVQVKNALLDIKIQEQTNREITALAYPQLSGSLSNNYFPAIPVQSIPDFISPSVYGVLVDQGVKDANGNAIQLPAGGFGIIPARFGTKYTGSVGLDASWIIFDGQVFIGLKARDAVMQFAKKNAEITNQTINTNVHKIYYQLVVGQEQLGSIDAAILRLERLLKDVTAIYKQGFTEKLDQEKVQVQLNNIQTEKIKIQNQLEAGKTALKFIIGMPQTDQLILIDSLKNTDLKKGILTDSVIDYNGRKEYQLLTIAETLGKLNIDRYNYNRLPQLVAFSSFSKNAQRNQWDFFGKGNWFTTALVGVKLNVPIFDGFANKAKKEKAKLELQKTQNNKIQIEQFINNEVAQSKIKIKNALLTLDRQTVNEALALKVYQTIKKKYEQGLGSMQEIYDAERELRVTQNDYFAALYDAIIARVDYLSAIGKL